VNDSQDVVQRFSLLVSKLQGQSFGHLSNQSSSQSVAYLDGGAEQIRCTEEKFCGSGLVCYVA
jgi:hypothetical protein